MKGFSEHETEKLLNMAKSAKSQGKSLTEVFESFAQKTKRAKGSVRNYYYLLLSEKDNTKVKQSGLKAEKNVAFSEQEEKALIRNVLNGVSQGKSVRRAIMDLALGDDKKALRMQNKYRNLLKTKPNEIEEIARELKVEKFRVIHFKNATEKNPLIKRVENEIDKLLIKIKRKYSEENLMLIEENKRLKEENERLKNIISTKKIEKYFQANKQIL